MAELVLDVHLELDPVSLFAERDPTRAVAEIARREAETKCAERGARLRHPEPREVIVRRALDAITGDSVMLVATRWLADGPD